MNEPQICIPKTGDILLIHIEKKRYFISIARFLYISSVSGIWIRKFVRPRKMVAMKRFFELVKCDNLASCGKCVQHTIKFYTSIREGNEIAYSGYERSLLDKIRGRNK